MNKAYFILAAALITGLTGCKKSNVTTPGKSSIKISTAIEAITKAPQLNDDGSGIFTDGDIFTLFISDEASHSTSTDYTCGHTELYWDDIEFATDNTTLKFAACYPQQTLNNGCFTFDLATAANKDLLWSLPQEVVSGTDKTINMHFKHAMHRLVINYTVDEAYADTEISTTCTAKSSCVVNLTDGTLDNSSSQQHQFSAKGTTVTFTLVPQATSDVTLDITAGDATKTVSIDELTSDETELKGGSQLEINLNIKDGQITLEGFTIGGWGDQGSIGGEIIM